MGYVSNAAINAAAKKAEMNAAMRGRTPEQKDVIKYFYGAGGCLSKKLSDQDYEAMVRAKVNSINFKARALSKLGIDEEQVNEIEPLHFEDYYFDEKRTYAKLGKDRIWRSSAYQVSWVFFSNTQIYVYQYTFNMDEGSTREATEEFFYKDITNVSAVSDAVEKEVADKVSCTGSVSYIRSTVQYDRVAFTVPGDKLYCSMKATPYTEKAIQGMKAKLREKKEQ